MQARASARANAPAGSATRREARKRTVLTGLLASWRGAYTIECIIMDLSKSGARVRVERGAEIGNSMILVHLREKIAVETRVVWRRGCDLGLEFKRTHDLSEATSSEMLILRRRCVDFRPTLICAREPGGRFRG